MRKIAFIIGILGLGLILAMLLGEAREVDSLDGLLVGEVVEIRGIVEEEREFGPGKLLVINEMPVFCECMLSYSGMHVRITGAIEKFPDELRIRAFSIEEIEEA